MIEKEYSVENKKILVYDNVFSQQEVNEIYTLISQRPYRNHNVDDSLHHNKHIDVKWSSEIDEKELLLQTLLTKYSEVMPMFFDGKYAINRSYVNYATHGTVDLIHEDCAYYIKDNFTILQFGNFYWTSNWHGETVFYDSNMSEILFSCSLKPGRIIVFDSSIPHSARQPSKIAEYPRYTIAMKIHKVGN
jgi:hypothetical protein